jgi:hypothetical protein
MIIDIVELRRCVLVRHSFSRWGDLDIATVNRHLTRLSINTTFNGKVAMREKFIKKLKKFKKLKKVLGYGNDRVPEMVTTERDTYMPSSVQTLRISDTLRDTHIRTSCLYTSYPQSFSNRLVGASRNTNHFNGQTYSLLNYPLPISAHSNIRNCWSLVENPDGQQTFGTTMIFKQP